jgi:hypothetical protein
MNRTPKPKRRCATAEGKGRKQAARKLLADRRESYVRHARRMLLLDLLANGTATADDVSDVAPLPKGIAPRALSGVPGALVRLNIIRAVGRVPSVRPGHHAIHIWVVVDRAAAEQWLRDHPDGPDPLATVGCASNRVFLSSLNPTTKTEV